MTLNRMGSTRGKNNRKLWLTGTLTLGAVAASGGVAMASLHEEPEHSKVTKASQSLSKKSSDEHDREEEAKKEKAKADRIKGQVCIKLDKSAQKAIADAGAASKGGTITVPLNKVEVLPCPKSKDPKPAPTGTTAPVTPVPTTSTSAPVKTTTTPPKTTPPKTTPPAPKPTTPKPTVTSTAS